MKDRKDIIADLLIRWEDSFEHGDELSVDDLCTDHPELIDDIRAKIDDLKKMSWMNQDAESPSDDQPDELIGQTLGGRYKVESLIGRGGFGSVFRAFDQELERHVAIKFSTATLGNDSEALVEEARKVAKLRHSGIVSVHDVGKHDGSYFVVSELIEGNDLSELIRKEKLNTTDAVLLVAEVAENLSAAHKAGFVHRDIKPANILIDEDGKPLVADFGIASMIESVSESSCKGTLTYMSPEQVANEPSLIDQRSDIYSLGVVLYELLTGELPYSARTPGKLREQILFRAPKPFTDESIPDSVQRVCLKSLAKHPSDRFATAQDFAAALRQSLTEKPQRDSSFVKWTGLLLLGLVLLGGGYFAGRIFHSPEAVTTTVEGGIEFVGTRRIVTPVKNFAPVTLEAWFVPRSIDNSEIQFVIGSDVPGHWGIGMGVGKNGHPMAETIGGGVDATRFRLSSDRWNHVAVVFGSEDTRVYLDGRLAATCEPTNQPEVESPFVIGNLGEQQGNMCFNGKLRSVRISEGERFSEDFIPDGVFAGTSALLIYDYESFDGEVIKDLSGHGHHGKWDSFIEDTGNSVDASVAKLILGFGGEVEILSGSGRRRILDLRDLPKERFLLTEVKLLSNSDFNDSHLEQLLGLSRLEAIYLSGSSMTDDGMKVIASFETLRQVGVGNSVVTNQGIAELQDLQRLTFLNIGNTKITDDVFDTLKQMKNLRQLHIPVTPSISAEAVERFKQSNPDCFVQYSVR